MASSHFSNFVDELRARTEIEDALKIFIRGIDRLLEPYGGFRAIARAEQISNWFVMNEMHQLRTMSTVMPAISAMRIGNCREDGRSSRGMSNTRRGACGRATAWATAWAAAWAMPGEGATHDATTATRETMTAPRARRIRNRGVRNT